MHEAHFPRHTIYQASAAGASKRKENRGSGTMVPLRSTFLPLHVLVNDKIDITHNYRLAQQNLPITGADARIALREADRNRPASSETV